MKYLQGLLLSIFLCFSLIQCSNNSTPEQSEYIRVLDEIPEHIQGVENLTVFPGDSEPMYSIELIPEQTYGESGEPYLNQIYLCAVDDQGRVIIWNMGSNYEHFLYVYNDNGIYQTQIGGRGKGPGEFDWLGNLETEAGKVLVRDVTNQRLNVYNTDDYSFERTMLIERFAIRDHEAVQGLEFGVIMTRNDGNHLVNFYQRVSDTGWPIHKYLLMDTDGNALDFEPLEFRSSFKAQGQTGAEIPMSFMPMPFMGSTITGMSDEGELYSVWSQDFLIRKYDAKGVYQSAIYYPVKGSPFDLSLHTPTPFYDQSDVMRALDMYDQELPESNPVIATLKVDDKNRIWVAVPAGMQRDSYEWWILNETGELLAKLLLPTDEPICDIKNGYLYSKKTNEETGAEYVVKYRIELTEK